MKIINKIISLSFCNHNKFHISNNKISNLEQIRYNNFIDLGVKKYKILSALDIETCEFCGNMDLKEFNLKDYKTGVTAPPFHDGCRCTICPAFDDEFDNIGERVARNPITHKTYYVPVNMSYKEWKKQYIDANLEEKRTYEITKLKNQNLQNDYTEYMQYQKIFKRNNIGYTLDAFQDIKYNNSTEYKKILQYFNLYINGKLSTDISYTNWKKSKETNDK